MPNVEKFQISPHLACGEILNYSTCEEISDFSAYVMHRKKNSPHSKNITRIADAVPFALYSRVTMNDEIALGQKSR